MSSVNVGLLPRRMSTPELADEVVEFFRSAITRALSEDVNRGGQLKWNVSVLVEMWAPGFSTLCIHVRAHKGEPLDIATERILRDIADGRIKIEEFPPNEPYSSADLRCSYAVPTPRVGELIICLFTPLNRQLDRLADHAELFTTEWVPRFGERIARWIYIGKAVGSAVAVIKIVAIAAIADWVSRVFWAISRLFG
jgi:hypothetical protein